MLAPLDPEGIESRKLFHHGIETMTSCTHWASVTKTAIYLYSRLKMLELLEANAYDELISDSGCGKLVPCIDLSFARYYSHHVLIDSADPGEVGEAAVYWLFQNSVLGKSDRIDVINDRDRQITHGDFKVTVKGKIMYVEVKEDFSSSNTHKLFIQTHEKRISGGLKSNQAVNKSHGYVKNRQLHEWIQDYDRKEDELNARGMR